MERTDSEREGVGGQVVLRALLSGVATTIGALMVYPAPPSLEAWWQPCLMGLQAALTSLGISAVVPASRPRGR